MTSATEMDKIILSVTGTPLMTLKMVFYMICPIDPLGLVNRHFYRFAVHYSVQLRRTRWMSNFRLTVDDFLSISQNKMDDGEPSKPCHITAFC